MAGQINRHTIQKCRKIGAMVKVESPQEILISFTITSLLGGKVKARRQFFDCEQNAVREDLRYIMTLYFSGRDFASIKTPSRLTRMEHQRMILQLFNYRLCDSDAKVEPESFLEKSSFPCGIMYNKNHSYLYSKKLQMLHSAA